MYTRIEQAVDQITIVSVMEASAGVLKSLNKEVGGVENVESVVEKLQEEMGKVDEVGKALEEPLAAGAMTDEGGIDDELEAMEQEERRAREEKEADTTRKRLQELDKQEALTKETEEREADRSTNSHLEESTKRLSQMSIEDDGRAQDGSAKEMRKISEQT